jgi:hypothetical protein
MASDPEMRKQASAMNKLVEGMNDKQKDVWKKLCTGTYIPTDEEMKMMVFFLLSFPSQILLSVLSSNAS